MLFRLLSAKLPLLDAGLLRIGQLGIIYSTWVAESQQVKSVEADINSYPSLKLWVFPFVEAKPSCWASGSACAASQAHVMHEALTRGR